MSNPNRDERSAPDALGLMVGWLWILMGVCWPSFGSLKEWRGYLTLIAIGAAFIVPILWRERRERSGQKPVIPNGLLAGWVWIVMGVASLGFGSLKEWKAPLTLIAFGAGLSVQGWWSEHRKRSAQKGGGTEGTNEVIRHNPA